ncbi:MAG: sugar ABC transporter permease [Lachnospiraceae bacterium]|nr:sugar ABC transporter permease [Lachnospiraceae bacterium]
MKKNKKMQAIWKARYIYILLAAYFVWLLIFHYGPMYGLLLAFKKYNAKLGIWGSEWVGLDNLKRIFVTPIAMKAIWNTLTISVRRIIFQFPFPIILAILITEMRGRRLKKVYQTIFTFPHFLSWVVVGAILTNFLSGSGTINMALANMGFEKINFLGNSKIFTSLLFVTANWKGMGWSAIVYMAAIAGIDPTLYDAARVDGASRWQQIWHITLAGIRATIAIMLILDIGGIMNAGFDQIFNMRNDVVNSSVTILDTYVYDITFGAVPNYGFSTAVGLFKSVIDFILLILANQISGRLSKGEHKLI